MAELNAADASRMTFELLTDSDGSVLVKISGELDMSTVSSLEATVNPILTGRSTPLVVDVSGVDFADSSAIALWVSWANRVGQIDFREPPLLIRRVIARMGLSDRLRMAPD